MYNNGNKYPILNQLPVFEYNPFELGKPETSVRIELQSYSSPIQLIGEMNSCLI